VPPGHWEHSAPTVRAGTATPGPTVPLPDPQRVPADVRPESPDGRGPDPGPDEPPAGGRSARTGPQARTALLPRARAGPRALLLPRALLRRAALPPQARRTARAGPPQRTGPAAPAHWQGSPAAGPGRGSPGGLAWRRPDGGRARTARHQNCSAAHAADGPREVPRWMTPTARTHRAPGAWSSQPCSRLRAPWRARRPGPLPLLSCLGPSKTGRTVVTAGGCSLLAAHRVLIRNQTRFRLRRCWQGAPHRGWPRPGSSVRPRDTCAGRRDPADPRVAGPEGTLADAPRRPGRTAQDAPRHPGQPTCDRDRGRRTPAHRPRPRPLVAGRTSDDAHGSPHRYASAPDGAARHDRERRAHHRTRSV
jgi:hypothetical protein